MGQISWDRVSKLLAEILLLVTRISAVGENLASRDSFAHISDVARISAVGENLGSRDSFAPIVDVARKFFLVCNYRLLVET